MSAVMDVDFSPTGREFVAGSYDRSVRIFSYNGGHSREVRAGFRAWGLDHMRRLGVLGVAAVNCGGLRDEPRVQAHMTSLGYRPT